MEKDDLDVRSKEFKEACQPVVDFLNKYGCPHSTVIVTPANSEFLNGECVISYELLD